ncbi:MAG: DUF1444 family protein [Planctomycetota bacterium]
MSSMPMQPDAFAEQVVSLLRSMQPEYEVILVGPSELLVNGRRLDLDNLFRMVSHEPGRGQEIVEHFLDQLFTGDALDMADLPLDLARGRIMPRIQPESIFTHLSRELVAHVPFVNDTVIVFVTDLPQMTVSITTEQVVRWGIDTDELESIARANLETYAPELSFQAIESREGGKAVIVSEQDGYDAARLLLGGLYRQLGPMLGGDFFVATPARDMFVAMSTGPAQFVERLRTRVSEDYERMPYPITGELFYVTQDGVAGTMGPGLISDAA